VYFHAGLGRTGTKRNRLRLSDTKFDEKPKNLRKLREQPDVLYHGSKLGWMETEPKLARNKI